MRIEFEIEQKGLLFRDAIELPDSHTLSDDDIDAMKRQRFDAWLAASTPENAED
jgi:hypothetical protein